MASESTHDTGRPSAEASDQSDANADTTVPWVEFDETVAPHHLRLAQLGARVLRQLSGKAEVRSFMLPQDSAVMVVQQGRGGATVVIAENRQMLLMTSAQGPEIALRRFRAGERTNVDRLVQKPESRGL